MPRPAFLDILPMCREAWEGYSRYLRERDARRQIDFLRSLSEFDAGITDEQATNTGRHRA
jgi:hypothetical protein